MPEIGARDPYNVTEDADLGMRLARFGFLTTVIPSTTYEEAPAHFRPWLKQRTRWLKGWMLTWAVHMHSPLRLLRELGPGGFVVFQLLVGGSALAALVHVPFALRIIWLMTTTDDGLFAGFTGFDAAALVSGYLISATLGLIGLGRRGLLGCAWALLFMPIYWLLLSLAAWRALLQLLRKPYLWEKTEHGLARTSRLDDGAANTAPQR
jgi:cellulose synthase/poly-beta-1,6-N-acetylglucosamine synthase-like glycosyltransferase